MKLLIDYNIKLVHCAAKSERKNETNYYTIWEAVNGEWHWTW